MAEAFAYHLGVDARLQRQCGVCVAQVVQADPRQSCGLQRLLKELGDSIGVPGLAVLARKDVAIALPGPEPLVLVGPLLLCLSAKGLDCPLVDRNDPRPTGLRFLLECLVANLDPRATYRQSLTV